MSKLTKSSKFKRTEFILKWSWFEIATVVGDVSVSEVRQEIVNATLSTFGKVDVLVNSAGVLIPGSPIPGLHPQDAQKMMDVNVQAACDLSLAFKDHLIANKGSSADRHLGKFCDSFAWLSLKFMNLLYFQVISSIYRVSLLSNRYVIRLVLFDNILLHNRNLKRTGIVW